MAQTPSDSEGLPPNSKLAVVSDIHGNLEALRAVLIDLESQGPVTVICLGDAVGYGPDPEAVVHLLMDQKIPCIQGNHEQAALFAEQRSWFNPTSRKSLDITQTLLSPELLEIIAGWPTHLACAEYYAVHGCPPDDAFSYLFALEEEELATLFGRFSQPVCFVGHPHTLFLASWQDSRARLEEIKPGRLPLNRTDRHIINVGSVGQPRDGSRSAKYALWDSARFTLEIRSVRYDAGPTIAKIKALGFPEINYRSLGG
ncbi:MAG: metallophosphoesterase family protein [Desulforhopalus sp.]|nr:metallophosphoesterase family protein [Desulforhopalus sp.]